MENMIDLKKKTEEAVALRRMCDEFYKRGFMDGIERAALWMEDPGDYDLQRKQFAKDIRKLKGDCP